MENDNGVSICILCCCDLPPGNLSMRTPSIRQLRKQLTCNRCNSLIKRAQIRKKKLCEREEDVRRQQMELVAKLRKLESDVESFKGLVLELDQVISTATMLEKTIEQEESLRERKSSLLEVRGNVMMTIEDLKTCYQYMIAEAASQRSKHSCDSQSTSRNSGSEKNTDHIIESSIELCLTEIKKEPADEPTGFANFEGSDGDGRHADDFNDFDSDYNPDGKDNSDTESSGMELDKEKDVEFPKPKAKRKKRGRGRPGSNIPVECDVCGRSFKYRSFMLVHRRTHMSQKDRREARGDPERSIQQREKNYLCTICAKKFSTEKGLQRHEETHNGSNDASESLQKKNQKESVRKSKSKRVLCVVCGKLVTRNNLTVHLRNHAGEKPYECSVCQKGFSLKSDLARHSQKHTGEKPYKCDQCHKGYTRLFVLQRHQKGGCKEGKSLKTEIDVENSP